ncbi:hypothetical protein Rumeso_04112 [Rubellimicrobium mesophilum DSM 19309]|uniref:Uncharacterized protein n=1 Tax=Rubellimicrobium mesophilum DSM 19309 TaxID=442562 RepID=A0A017HIZ3_9RHOB|nr:hypothetical protein Rumeso_04112 [Rubellimicrobium mesophilum DSM 19309]
MIQNERSWAARGQTAARNNRDAQGRGGRSGAGRSPKGSANALCVLSPVRPRGGADVTDQCPHRGRSVSGSGRRTRGTHRPSGPPGGPARPRDGA